MPSEKKLTFWEYQMDLLSMQRSCHCPACRLSVWLYAPVNILRCLLSRGHIGRRLLEAALAVVMKGSSRQERLEAFRVGSEAVNQHLDARAREKSQ